METYDKQQKKTHTKSKTDNRARARGTMIVTAARRGRNGAVGAAAQTAGSITVSSVNSSGAITGSTLASTSTAGPPVSHSDTVNVAMHCSGGMSVNGTLHTQYLRTTEHHIVSDERTKSNVQPLHANVIRGLKPVSYQIRSTGNETVGFVAQSVELLDPRLVHKAEGGEYSLDYRAISVHAVHALQELLVVRDADAAKYEHMHRELCTMASMIASLAVNDDRRPPPIVGHPTGNKSGPVV